MGEKKKLIRVAGRGQNSIYSVRNMNFAFVSSSQDGRKQATAIMTCREDVNQVVWAAHNNQDVGRHNANTDAHIDKEVLRLLIVYSPTNEKEFKQKLFNGKAALNILEHLAGWKRSTITTVVHSKYKHAWLLTGSPEWMAQPQLLSLCTWILRLSSLAGPLNVDNYDALEKSIHDLKNKDSGQRTTDCRTFGQQFWNKMYIIVKYYKEIFGNMPKEKAWKPETHNSFGVYSGFYTFCTQKISYSYEAIEAQKRFDRLCGKHLVRKNPLINRR